LQANLLPSDHFLPAAAQGIVAFEVYGDDPQRDAWLQAITHQPTWRALQAERAFLRHLKAGCHTPIGLRTFEMDDVLHLHALVFPDSPDSAAAPRSAKGQGPSNDPEAVAAGAFVVLNS
jgi:hydroxymethylbilane synthase